MIASSDMELLHCERSLSNRRRKENSMDKLRSLLVIVVAGFFLITLVRCSGLGL
jgi:hypothetical protein